MSPQPQNSPDPMAQVKSNCVFALAAELLNLRCSPPTIEDAHSAEIMASNYSYDCTIYEARRNAHLAVPTSTIQSPGHRHERLEPGPSGGRFAGLCKAVDRKPSKRSCRDQHQ